MKKKQFKHTMGTVTGICLLVFAVLFLSFYAGGSGLQTGQAADVDVDPKQEMVEGGIVSELITKEERLSYALGMDFGKRLRSQEVTIDPDVFMQGLSDARAGALTLLTDRETRDILLELQRELEGKDAAQKATPSGDLSGIRVSFKIDPRLAKGMYMGDRWVSPPTYIRVGKGGEVVVEAKAQVLDASGRKVDSITEWVTSEPDIAEVTTGRDGTVKIIVKRPGKSSLKVVSGEHTKEMVIRAIEKDSVIHVEIEQ